MFTAIVMAYMLNGNPVLKTINVPYDQVASFYKPDKIMKGKLEMKCVIFLNRDYKGDNQYLSPDSCKDLEDRYNREKWK